MNPPRHWMRPIQPHDLEVLHERAREDRHEVIAPTHVFTKEGEIVGCVSIGAVPLMLPWFHTRLCHARDSVYYINQMENLAANLFTGSGLICVPVVKESPFQQHIGRLGYLEAGSATVTFKKVR